MFGIVSASKNERIYIPQSRVEEKNKIWNSKNFISSAGQNFVNDNVYYNSIVSCGIDTFYINKKLNQVLNNGVVALLSELQPAKKEKQTSINRSKQKEIFDQLLNQAKDTYLYIYNKTFNEKKYDSFFNELLKVNFSDNSTLYLYNNSVRFDLKERKRNILIEYSAETDFLTVSSMQDNQIYMEECRMNELKSVVDKM